VPVAGVSEGLGAGGRLGPQAGGPGC